MSNMGRHQPEADETPGHLRARAQSIRWATQNMTDDERIRELLEFADQLEARAAAIEAKTAQEHCQDEPPPAP